MQPFLLQIPLPFFITTIRNKAVNSLPIYSHHHYHHHQLMVARYSFLVPIPPKFEHKLRCHKQSFGKIATTVVLDKDENLL